MIENEFITNDRRWLVSEKLLFDIHRQLKLFAASSKRKSTGLDSISSYLQDYYNTLLANESQDLFERCQLAKIGLSAGSVERALKGKKGEINTEVKFELIEFIYYVCKKRNLHEDIFDDSYKNSRTLYSVQLSEVDFQRILTSQAATTQKEASVTEVNEEQLKENLEKKPPEESKSDNETKVVVPRTYILFIKHFHKMVAGYPPGFYLFLLLFLGICTIVIWGYVHDYNVRKNATAQNGTTDTIRVLKPHNKLISIPDGSSEKAKKIYRIENGFFSFGNRQNIIFVDYTVDTTHETAIAKNKNLSLFYETINSHKICVTMSWSDNAEMSMYNFKKGYYRTDESDLFVSGFVYFLKQYLDDEFKDTHKISGYIWGYADGFGVLDSSYYKGDLGLITNEIYFERPEGSKNEMILDTETLSTTIRLQNIDFAFLRAFYLKKMLLVGFQDLKHSPLVTADLLKIYATTTSKRDSSLRRVEAKLFFDGG